MSTVTPHYIEGKWYVYDGYDALGKPVPIEVDPPQEIAPVQPAPSPLSTMAQGLVLPPKATVSKAKWLLHREPKTDGTYGKWYQSIWFWFWVIVTAFFARWWISVTWPESREMSYGMVDHPDADDYFLALAGWVWWGWMPLGIGVIGALQKAGYKRLAMAWSVTLTALMAMFFSRNQRTTKPW